uniref:Uncharacterized protein n=1 Tax=Loa loa TaxID=7209 RepID=A0A1I7V663_LOALO
MRNDEKGKKAVVVLEIYKKDFESIVEQTKTQPKESTQQNIIKTVSLSTINLPQLPLPIFSGNSKKMEFRSSFEAAVHSQTIPRYTKIKLSIFLLEGRSKSLYNELHAIKRCDRKWKSIIESIERILRQLEAIGENLEHSSIETVIESKLPGWVLDKVYQQNGDDDTWSVTKFRQFLRRLVKRNDQVTRSQASTNGEQQFAKFKSKRLQRNVQKETTAL